jgi:hypothetical protein
MITPSVAEVAAHVNENISSPAETRGEVKLQAQTPLFNRTWALSWENSSVGEV